MSRSVLRSPRSFSPRRGTARGSSASHSARRGRWNLEVFSASIGGQLLERGLIDEIDLHIAPVLLGDGIRLFDNPGGAPVRLELLNGDDHSAAVNVRYHPVATR